MELFHPGGADRQAAETSTTATQVIPSFTDEHLFLLIDPLELGRLVALNLLRLEPQSNLLLGTLDGIGAVADVATDINGIVTTDGAGGGGKRVGGTKNGCSRLVCGLRRILIGELTTTGLASITTLPNHGDDWAAQHVCVSVSLAHNILFRLSIQVTSPLKKGLDDRSS